MCVYWFSGRKVTGQEENVQSPEATHVQAVRVTSHRHVPCIKTTRETAFVRACCFICWGDPEITPWKSRLMSCKSVTQHNTVVCNVHRQYSISQQPRFCLLLLLLSSWNLWNYTVAFFSCCTAGTKPCISGWFCCLSSSDAADTAAVSPASVHSPHWN